MCNSTIAAVSNKAATAWCSVASAIGTTSSSVATPIRYCTNAAPRKAASAKRVARGERTAKPTTRVAMAGQGRQRRQQPMVELYGGDVLRQIAHERFKSGVIPRHQAPVHQREGIVVEARVSTGGEATRQHGQRNTRAADPGQPVERSIRRGSWRHRPQHRQTGPQNGGIEGQGECQMDHQPVWRHSGRLGLEAGSDHEPADRALQSAQNEQQGETRAQSAFDRSARPKPDQRHDERQSDQAAPQPVGPFQPEDALEAGEATPSFTRVYCGICW